ncbi:hypothetical protein ACS0TY_031197 [Phlomoides rotata]
MAHGHMIPMIDMVKLFASRGPITRARDSGHEIGLSIIDFPPKGSSLPDNIVRFDQLTTPDLIPKFIGTLELLQQPTESILQELHPNCIISDMFLPWTADSAAKFGIPRLVFYGTSCISQRVSVQMGLHTPYEKVSSDFDTFFVPNIPHQLMFVRTQVAQFALKAEGNEWSNLLRLTREVMEKCLIASRSSNPIMWIITRIITTFTPAQLHEIVVGLEASGQDFIWVVRRGKNQEDWLPQGFEERIKGRGLIIRGWAPQVMILDHPSIGAFMTLEFDS